MLDSAIPTKIGVIWAASASSPYVNTIPVASQIGIQNGRASFTDGFPPNCFIPIASGGAPPFGGDFNGILQLVSQWLQWQAAGGPAIYDGTFQSTVGGYPNGAVVIGSNGVQYQSQVDNNTTNPATGGAGWAQYPPPPAPALSSGITATKATAGATVTFTANYVAVAAALGGQTFSLASFSETFNGATTGAGGMDTGSLPASGFVSIYAIYDPATGTPALLGTTASETPVYGGAHMPSGYTASALLGIWPTTAGSLLVAGNIIGRQFYWASAPQVLSAGVSTSVASVDISPAAPAAANLAVCQIASIETASVTNTSQSNFGSINSGTGLPYIVSANTEEVWNSAQIPIFTAQTLYYKSGKSSIESGMVVSGYQW